MKVLLICLCLSVAFAAVDKDCLFRGKAKTCTLTTKFVEATYTKARRGKNVTSVSVRARVLLETTKLLQARRIPLNVLARLDLTQTKIGADCPQKFRWSLPNGWKCREKAYRSNDGACNNAEHGNWGTGGTAFLRLLPADYQDGVEEPRKARDGSALPSARLVSLKLHSRGKTGGRDRWVTMAFVAWGQAVYHDMALTARQERECCGVRDRKSCLPIEVAKKDPIAEGGRCLTFTRSAEGLAVDCALGARQQLNEVSAYIDAGFIYGADSDDQALRTLRGGLLKTSSAPRKGSKELLPLKTKKADEGCIGRREGQYCFQAGDQRVNDHITLTVLYTLLVREHNRIARKMSAINAKWEDEKTFQETRRIVGAMVQHITYHEFLPLLLGKRVKQLKLAKNEEFKGYDERVNAGVSASFATAAFRFGHSLIPDHVERWSTNDEGIVGCGASSEGFRQPFDLSRPGRLDQYAVGSANQLAQSMNGVVSTQVRNQLFQEPGQRYGSDLVSKNIQRGRDHGLPSYTEYRKYCGRKSVDSWDKFFAACKGCAGNDTRKWFQETYGHPEDVDLWTAGLYETRVRGGIVGTTFACIIADQFSRTRVGDRHWYENPDVFTSEQLGEIRKVTLAGLVCRNGDDIGTVQKKVMMAKKRFLNPEVDCGKMAETIDLAKWREV